MFSVHEPYAFPALKDDSTIATWLTQEGYSTSLLGKYMNGYGFLPEPGRTTGKSLRYKPPGWTQLARLHRGRHPESSPTAASTYHYFDTTLSLNGEGFSAFEDQLPDRRLRRDLRADHASAAREPRSSSTSATPTAQRGR